MPTYQAWHDPADHMIICGTVEQLAEARRRGQLSERAEYLYSFEAATVEEAQAIHYLRMGWGAYQPIGNPAPCPNCDAWYYPQGSGQCWRCDSAGN